MSRSEYSRGAAIAAVILVTYNLAVVLAVIFFVPKLIWDMELRNICIGIMAGVSGLSLAAALPLKQHIGERLRTMVFVSCGIAGIVVFRWFMAVLMW